MPMRSQRQRRWMWATHPEMAKRWEEHTPKGTKLPERVSPKTAYALGTAAALAAFGVKEAGWLGSAASRLGGFVGKGLQWGGKALGFLPSGVGNAVGAVVGGAGGALEGLANGEGLRGVAARGALGAASSALPFAAGTALQLGGNAALSRTFTPPRRPASAPSAIGQV